MIKLIHNGKTRVIKNISVDNGEVFEATYRNHHILICPYGYTNNHISVEVLASDGTYVVNTTYPVTTKREEILVEILNNIL
jgi:hypothetical protein